MSKRLLRPHFSVAKKRLKRWPKRKDFAHRNPILALLAPKDATIRGLSLRTGIKLASIWRVFHGRLDPRLKDARLLSRALNVSTDQLADVLEAYAPKRARVSKTAIPPREPKS